MAKTKRSKGGIFKNMLSRLFSKLHKESHLSEKNSVKPLEDFSMKDLELEPLEQETQTKEPDIEIAFINPDTGELEVLSLPQDMFQVKVSEQETEDEHVVVLELKSPPRREDKEEDPYSKITHYPPSSRLH